jgi:hypothetical protein
VIPAAAGISTGAIDSGSFADGFSRGMWIAAAVCMAGGVLSAVTIRNPPRPDADTDEPVRSCPLDAPPLRAHPHPAMEPATETASP